jgi:hypothetical protein
MIKEGDKVICIAEHIHYRNPEDSNPLTHKIGNCYEVSRYDPSDNTMYITAEEKYSDVVYGLWFSMRTGSTVRDCFYFSDYFITLAEWRQQQIDKILEDE